MKTPSALTTNAPSSCASSLIVPRRFAFEIERRSFGCPASGSRISGRDRSRTACSSPNVNNVPMRRPSRPSRAISTASSMSGPKISGSYSLTWQRMLSNIGARSGKIQLHFVHETPAPRLARLQRAHHRVTGGVRMLAGMFVARRVAAAHVPAGHAQPQMEPPIARLHAFLAPGRVGLYVFMNLIQMSAHFHMSVLLFPDYQLTPALPYRI